MGLLLSSDILEVRILGICQVTHQPSRWIGVTWTSSASDSMVTFSLLHSQRRTLESRLSESLSQSLLAEEEHQVRLSFTNASEEQLQGPFWSTVFSRVLFLFCRVGSCYTSPFSPSVRTSVSWRSSRTPSGSPIRAYSGWHCFFTKAAPERKEAL